MELANLLNNNMGVTKDPRREKINELKLALKGATELFKKAAEELQDLKNKTVTEEEKKKILNDMIESRTVCEALTEELEATRRNKLGSSFFEFIPSPPNRKMRRAAFRQLRNR